MTQTGRERAKEVLLRRVAPGDLPMLFEQQLDLEANQMAVTNPRDRAAFEAHWERVLANPGTVARAIVADGELAGQISCFQSEGLDCVGYWIAKEHWGRGIAGRALALLLAEVVKRPLFAQAARTNGRSLRVLERCGFRVIAHRHAPATERFPACEETVLRLG